MAIYAITVEEKKCKTVVVEAESLDEAIDLVTDAYQNMDIDLSYVDTDVEICRSYYAHLDGTATEDQIELCERVE